MGLDVWSSKAVDTDEVLPRFLDETQVSNHVFRSGNEADAVEVDTESAGPRGPLVRPLGLSL